MHRTSLRDFEESRTLFAGQLAAEFEPPLDPVEVSVLCEAFRTVHCVHPRVTQAYADFVQRPFFTSRVQRDRHRRSSAQSSQEQIVRIRAGISPAEVDRLVGAELV